MVLHRTITLDDNEPEYFDITWEEVREARDKELNQATDQSILDSRAALRTECSSKETEVNALTTKRDIATIRRNRLHLTQILYLLSVE